MSIFCPVQDKNTRWLLFDFSTLMYYIVSCSAVSDETGLLTALDISLSMAFLHALQDSQHLYVRADMDQARWRHGVVEIWKRAKMFNA